MTTDANQPTALRLLLAAERLFAEEGVDAVSTRRISAAAGQRNNSALQYHYVNKDALVEAILEYRQVPINRRRMDLLQRLEQEGLALNVQALVEAMVLPFVELLAGPVEDSYYVSLVAQLYSQQRLALLFPAEEGRAQSLYWAMESLQRALPELDDEELEQRLIFMGLTLNHVVAGWAHARRSMPADWSVARLHRQAAMLVQYLVGGLCQPATGRREWCLPTAESG